MLSSLSRKTTGALAATILTATSLVGVAASPAVPVSAQPAITDARQPSISADGRWVVYQALNGDRRSVYRTDRDTGETVELSLVPDGVRAGETINPQISADGCVVVATTEIAFDLFRDDDRAPRWDVYRLVVPECDGQPNGWELVSADPVTGVGVDGVDLESPASVSGAGTVVAYTHPSGDLDGALSVISVVDLSIPPGDPGRVSRVAGWPVEAPGGAYLYRGARQPALSQSGRHLAFTADFTASALLPGWGEGPEPGGAATSQVYVWDRDLTALAVTLVSGRDGQPSATGADSPAISGDGSVVAFTSTDPGLASDTATGCSAPCPPQVYRLDRDLDGNGVYDEPTDEPTLSLVSSAAHRQAEKIFGDAPSHSPVVSFDGSQVAFVTDATNLMPASRGGGGEPTDGDLLVAEQYLGELRRILDAPELSDVPGVHGKPALSETGGVVVFDSAATGELPGVESVTADGSRRILAVEAQPTLSLASVDFGTVLVSFESAELFVTVRNAGPGGFEPSSVTVTDAFAVTGGTCQIGILVAAGESCSVRLTFTPSEPREFVGELTVAGTGESAPSVTGEVRGTGGEPLLITEPGGVDFPDAVVGEAGGRAAVDIVNIGFAATEIAEIRLEGVSPQDFRIVQESCTNRALNPDASCAVEVEFVPTAEGFRSASLVAVAGGGPNRATNGSYSSALLGGRGFYAPVVSVVTPDGTPDGERFAGGDSVSINGSGFPSGTTVSVSLENGAGQLGEATVDDQGSFVASVTLPRSLRAGTRQLVVAATDQPAAATVTITIAAPERPVTPGVPGFGLGR